ncbi:3-hydroxybutyrate dehydrogenase [Marinobacterium nitratireducens]|uniref:3-hydroxybutyrate dehydrogenase n=1 Tax=Marinobacterium nitratireducens TaxID=518897 RepID=A0A917ZQ70_9GAMM|nr:3-hydroxybutyrate dehydrogenase [Marinobacterium nitratireducens]GGO87147.1 3-hydroxybutyrate dehydrogenase [Marinobacterium nitratireducens]
MSKTRTALVTGSSSGIGLATAGVLAQRGYQIMLHGLEDAELGGLIARKLADEHGVRTDYCQADLSGTRQVERLYRSCVEQFGAVDILVNNAGIQFTAATAEFPPEKWDLILAVNLSAAFHASRLALPAMQRAGWGRIINIASVHGLVASANKSAYCAAKHGLVGLTKVMALEHAADGITANAICPGWTDTPLLNQQFENYAKEHGVSFDEAKLGLIHTKTPYPSLIAPQAIGELAAYLCSDAAAGITGAALPIDGAWTAH